MIDQLPKVTCRDGRVHDMRLEELRLLKYLYDRKVSRLDGELLGDPAAAASPWNAIALQRSR